MRGSKHLIEFMLHKAIEDSKGDSRKAGREIKEIVLPLVNAIDSSIEQMHFIKKISDAAAIPEAALKDDLKKVPARTADDVQSGGEQGEVRKFRKDYIERKLLGIIVWQKTLSDPSIDIEDTVKNLALILDKSEELSRGDTP